MSYEVITFSVDTAAKLADEKDLWSRRHIHMINCYYFYFFFFYLHIKKKEFLFGFFSSNKLINIKVLFFFFYYFDKIQIKKKRIHCDFIKKQNKKNENVIDFVLSIVNECHFPSGEFYLKQLQLL